MIQLLILFSLPVFVGGLLYLIQRQRQEFIKTISYQNQEIEKLKEKTKTLIESQKIVTELVDEIDLALSILQLQIDCLAVDFYGHMQKTLHLNEEGRPVRAEVSIRQELNLAQLESTIQERAALLGFDVESTRPTGL